MRDRALALAAAALAAALARSRRKVGAALVYHRVGDPPGDPETELLPALGTELFRAQIALVAGLFEVVPASRLPERIAERRRGERVPVALTFDDDLESHVRVVAPALRALAVPATFFLNGVCLGGKSPYWWDGLQRAVDAGELDVLPPVPSELLAAALRRRPYAIHAVARVLERRPEAAERLMREPPPRLLEREDLPELTRPPFEVGFHTRRHRILIGRPPAELTDGRDELAAAVGAELETIAYPHGKADEAVAAAARDAGYRAGFTGRPEVIRAATSPWLLGRFEPFFSPPGRLALRLAYRLARPA